MKAKPSGAGQVMSERSRHLALGWRGTRGVTTQWRRCSSPTTSHVPKSVAVGQWEIISSQRSWQSRPLGVIFQFVETHLNIKHGSSQTKSIWVKNGNSSAPFPLHREKQLQASHTVGRPDWDTLRFQPYFNRNAFPQLFNLPSPGREAEEAITSSLDSVPPLY